MRRAHHHCARDLPTLAEHGAEVLLVDADTSAAGIGAALCLESDGSGIIAANHHAQRGDLDAPGLARLAPQCWGWDAVLTGVTHVSRRIELRAGSDGAAVAGSR